MPAMPNEPDITRTCCDCHRAGPQALLTYEEAGDLLRVSPRTIRNWSDEGRLERIELSHQVRRVTAASVEILIDAGRMAAAEETHP